MILPQIAVEQGHLEMVDRLVKAGADVEIELKVTERKGDERLLKILKSGPYGL